MAEIRRVKYGAKRMNMISTGSFLTETGASNKQSELVKKLTAAWEKKNSKSARAGGASLMALSLAACGGSDEVDTYDIDGVSYTTLEAVQTSNDAAIAEAATVQANADMVAAVNEEIGTSLTVDSTTEEVVAAIAASDNTEVMISTAELEQAKQDAEDAVDITSDNTAVMMTQDAYDAALQAARDAVDLTTDNATATDQAVADLGLSGISTLAQLNAAYTAAVASSAPVLTTAATNIATMSDNNDTVDATARNSLQTGDDITDASTTDADVLNANVTVATAAPTMRNVETANVTGDFLVTGLALTNVAGTDTLNLSTALAGGSATVTDAAVAAVENIVIGSNVTTVSVSALAAGTGAAGVNVDAGAASTVALEGGAGTDVFSVTIADGAALNLGANTNFGAPDTVNVTLNGDTTITSGAAMGTMDIASAVDSTVTVVTAVGTATDFTGAGNIILSGDASVLDTATSIASTGTGTLTLDLTTVANDNVSTVAADVINHNHATGTGLTIAETSSLNLDAAAGVATMNLSAAGTMTMTVSETQTNPITTGAAVTALNISATPDEAADTANGAVITMADLALNANTVNVAITGTDALTLTDLSTGAATTVNALNMSGDLTISELGAFDATIFLGNGTNSITSTDVAAGFTIEGGSGADTITLTGGNVTASTVDGNDGNDTILGGAGDDTIDGGDGDDTINGSAGADSITTGAGADTITVAGTEDGDVIADFTLGTDTLVLTGVAAAAVDLSAITPTAGAYAIGGANHDVTLTGSTATDLTSSVVLGSATAAYTLADTSTNVLGDGDDNVAVATTEDATVTTGAGSDTVTLATGATSAVTVVDFTAGSDKIVVTGSASDGASVDLGSITPTTGAYTIDTTAVVTITGATATDVSAWIQLGDANNAYSLDNTGNAGGISATGGNFNDYIDFGTIAANTNSTTVNFTDNGGVDTITGIAANSALSVVSFTGMTGINGTGTAVAANAAKVADAVDGAVYVFADGGDGTGSAAIATFTTSATVTANDILVDVADFLEAGITESDGENYIAVINDGTTMAYAYMVEADADGIDAADLTLLGTIDATTNAAITATDIA